MTDPLEDTQPLPAAELSTRGPLGQFRAELCLQLPDADPAGEDYDPDALAAWAADRMAALERDHLEAYAALELSQAAVLELTAAHTQIVVLGEQATRLEAIRQILRRGLRLTEAADLAATIGLEIDGIRATLLALFRKYPELEQLVAPDVEARSVALQAPDGSPLVAP